MFEFRLLDHDQYRRQIKCIRDENDFYERKREQANLAINSAVIVTCKKILEHCSKSKSLWKEADKQKRVEIPKSGLLERCARWSNYPI